MPRRTPSPQSSPARALLAALALVLLPACESAESKQMKQLAGTYALTSSDRAAARLLAGSTLTLEPDGTWHSLSAADPIFRRAAIPDSGSYRANGATIAVRSPVDGLKTYEIRGDTLVWQNEKLLAQTEMVTGIKMVGQIPTFYVRAR
jgi:hypothetical protein